MGNLRGFSQSTAGYMRESEKERIMMFAYYIQCKVVFFKDYIYFYVKSVISVKRAYLYMEHKKL